MSEKAKKLIIIVLVLFFIFQGIFFAFYFSSNKPAPQKPVVSANDDITKPITPLKTDNPDNQNPTGLNQDDFATAEKLTIVSQGKLQLTPRNLSSLESTLASRIPVNDRTIRFVWANNSKDVDCSQIGTAQVDNNTYAFNLFVHKGKFIEGTSTSYLLELQIPAQGKIKSVFKWYLFDTNLQVAYSLNLKEKGIDLPSKIIQTMDYDNDGKDELLVENTRYLTPDNYSSPRYLFKVLNDKQIALVWREESVNSDSDTGKCTSVTTVVFDQSNPPPPNDPELLSIKKISTSILSSGLPKENNSTITNNNQNSNIPIISNSVTYQALREYPDRQEIRQKTLDVYVYTWDLNKMEFVYTKKESQNLDANIN